MWLVVRSVRRLMVPVDQRAAHLPGSGICRPPAETRSLWVPNSPMVPAELIELLLYCRRCTFFQDRRGSFKASLVVIRQSLRKANQEIRDEQVLSSRNCRRLINIARGRAK